MIARVPYVPQIGKEIFRYLDNRIEGRYPGGRWYRVRAVDAHGAQAHRIAARICRQNHWGAVAGRAPSSALVETTIRSSESPTTHFFNTSATNSSNALVAGSPGRPRLSLSLT